MNRYEDNLIDNIALWLGVHPVIVKGTILLNDEVNTEFQKMVTLLSSRESQEIARFKNFVRDKLIARKKAIKVVVKADYAGSKRANKLIKKLNKILKKEE